MWIWMTNKSPQNLGVCQKTEGNSDGDFCKNREKTKKTKTWILDLLPKKKEELLPHVNGENHLRPSKKKKYCLNRANDKVIETFSKKLSCASKCKILKFVQWVKQ